LSVPFLTIPQEAVDSRHVSRAESPGEVPPIDELGIAFVTELQSVRFNESPLHIRQSPFKFFPTSCDSTFVQPELLPKLDDILHVLVNHSLFDVSREVSGLEN